MKKTIAVVGLGYVGLGLLVELSKTHLVIGYDICKERIDGFEKHHDRNQLFSEKQLVECKAEFTNKLEDTKKANFFYNNCRNSGFLL